MDKYPENINFDDIKNQIQDQRFKIKIILTIIRIFTSEIDKDQYEYLIKMLNLMLNILLHSLKLLKIYINFTQNANLHKTIILIT